MSGRKSLITAITIGIVAILLVCIMSSFVKQFKDYSDSIVEQRCKKCAANMAYNDYSIIWIGTPYEGIEEYVGNHLITMSPKEVSKSNMPVNNTFQKVKEYDEDGNVVKQKTRDEFAANIFIVVNAEEELAPETIEIIRLCVVNTNCELLAIGKTQTKSFREAFVLPDIEGVDDYFLYSALNGTDLDHVRFLDDKYSPCQRILYTFDMLLPLPQPTPVVVETYPSGDANSTSITETTEITFETESMPVQETEVDVTVYVRGN